MQARHVDDYWSVPRHHRYPDSLVLHRYAAPVLGSGPLLCGRFLHSRPVGLGKMRRRRPIALKLAWLEHLSIPASSMGDWWDFPLCPTAEKKAWIVAASVSNCRTGHVRKR